MEYGNNLNDRGAFMKRFIIVFAAAMMFLGSASAQTPSTNCSGATLTGVTALKSRYVVMPAKSPYNAPVVQSDLSVRLCDGVYGDEWFSFPKDFRQNGGLESDTTVGIAKKWGAVYIEYVDFPSLGDTKGDLVQTSLVLSPWTFTKGAHTFTPRLELWYLYVTEAPSKNSAPFVFAGLSDSWKMKLSPKTPLNFDFYVMRDGGIFHGDPTYVGSASVGLAIPFAGMTVTPGFRQTTGFGNSDRNHSVVFISLAKSWHVGGGKNR